MAEQNTSATGGALLPDADGPQPLEGKALNVFLQRWVVGIVGLDGRWVRPRWQAEPPNLPDADQNWMAIGVTTFSSDDFAYVRHNPAGDGADELQRQQRFELLVSAYGPQADSYIELLRDGIQIAQNREPLQLAGMGVVLTGEVIRAPALVKNLWQDRLDMRITMTRQINRKYPVLNILSAEGTLHADEQPKEITTSINVEE